VTVSHATTPRAEPDQRWPVRTLAPADARREEGLNRVTRLARQVLDVPYAVVALVEGGQLRVSSVEGVIPADTMVRGSLSRWALHLSRPTVVPDTALDVRFRGDALASGPDAATFFAGEPLNGPGGERLGTLAVFDHRPRSLTAAEAETLADLARWAELEIRFAGLAQGSGAFRPGGKAEPVREELLIVSHELRTPLTSIRGSLGLVTGGVMGEVPAEARQLLDIAVSNIDRMTRLVDGILDLERIRGGRMHLVRAVVPLPDLVDQAVGAVSGSAARGGVRIVVTSAATQVWVDPDRIVQALVNLLGNAVKFSPAGAVVRVDAHVCGGELTLRVSDEGRGIPPEHLERVFDPFAQVETGEAGRQGGIGLGLAITKAVVEAHGGRISVESTVGRGSTFFIAVPLVDLPRSAGRDRP
jgi:signal transduction histidine kinase